MMITNQNCWVRNRSHKLQHTHKDRQTGIIHMFCLLDRMGAQGMLKNLTLYSPPTPSFLITWRVTSIALPCPSWMRTCASIYPLNYMSFAPQFLLNSPLHMIIGLSLHQCLKQERRIQQVEGSGENRRDHESDHRWISRRDYYKTIDNQCVCVCVCVVAIILYIVDVTRKKKPHPRSFKNRKKQQQQAIKQKRTYSRLTTSSSLSKSLLCINDDIESKLQA